MSAGGPGPASVTTCTGTTSLRCLSSSAASTPSNFPQSSWGITAPSLPTNPSSRSPQSRSQMCTVTSSSVSH
ncbi:hypothetical protein C8Q76DRAFT_752262 [Earliella scabrosa]|nr:hypothetical protein C8Q76DRAFT_752262 [Earliella scabrosa]